MRVVGIAGKVRSLVNKAGLDSRHSFRDVQANGTAYKVKCPLYDNSVKADQRKVNKAFKALRAEFGDNLISAKIIDTAAYSWCGAVQYQAIVVHVKRQK